MPANRFYSRARSRSSSPPVLNVHGSSTESALPPLPPPSQEPGPPVEPRQEDAGGSNKPGYLSFGLENEWHAKENEATLKQLPLSFHLFAAAEKVPCEFIVDYAALGKPLEIYVGGTDVPIRR